MVTCQFSRGRGSDNFRFNGFFLCLRTHKESETLNSYCAMKLFYKVAVEIITVLFPR